MIKDHSRAVVRYKISPRQVIGDPSGPPPSICEVFRRIHRLADTLATDDPVLAGKLRYLTEIGYDMGKRMDLALGAKFGGENPNVGE